MRKNRLLICRLMFFVCCSLFFGLLVDQTVFAGVNDFYFSDFTGDYYLSKDTEGVSHLRVVESVTAEFPNYNQNKGICRQISYTNKDKTNVTLPNLNRGNLKLTRNGLAEPIYSIEKVDKYYNVCTGTEEYLLGKQTYVFEYEFEKVITEYDDNKHGYQELYWDTNGSGSMQRFDSVTARVHFGDGVESEFTGDSWCYVGAYGVSGQDRCEISKIDDGVEFHAEDLSAYENLTFDIEFEAGSFVVPGLEDDYTYFWLLIILNILCIISIILTIRKTLKLRAKAKYYKRIFAKPEYQPSKDYSLTEMAEVYLGEKKSTEVAMLLEMIVQHKVDLVKYEKKKWGLTVKEAVQGEYEDLLTILNNGTKPEVGKTIKIESHSATTKLIDLRHSMEKKVLSDIKRDGLVEEDYKTGSSKKRGLLNTFMMTMTLIPFILMALLFVVAILSGWLGLDVPYGKRMIIDEEDFFISALMVIVPTVMICVFCTDRVAQYKGFTEKGLKASKYMEGLKLYIGMAEADRMKILQSVEGADVSADGIVKLYEKLLPYAAIFGLEKSWMDEMKEYCKVEEIEEPDYLMSGITAMELSRGLHNAASYVATSTAMSSSGGSSSSGFSGGGGGGFSGGGGGGGGFSGR